jgi:hypothetical protein
MILIRQALVILSKLSKPMKWVRPAQQSEPHELKLDLSPTNDVKHFIESLLMG